MSKFVGVRGRTVDHPIFVDVDNILMVTADNLVFVAGIKAKLIDIHCFDYSKIAQKIKECSTDEWIELGYVVEDIGPLFINKKYFKGLNFVDDNYDMIFERGDYTGEITIQDLSIDDAIKIIDAINE